ncbi:MAG: rhodanese-like domain-containing protein [Eubacterium sp.]|nr:rhodanese-like domain-containing protein [Eubacterium sp.]
MNNLYKEISFEEAKKIMDAGNDWVLFDVREENEYVTGHAEGAELFPVDTINEETAARMIPGKDTKVMVYCRSGQRAALAGQRLNALGYKQVLSIGSLVGWPYGIEY